MYRSIYVTALASFIALSTQSAFAETAASDAGPVAAPVVAEAATHARTVAINSADTSRQVDALEEHFRLRVLSPALAGDGGG